jgi:hypothetical protein
MMGMVNDSLPTTEEWSERDEPEPEGEPIFLVAFPQQVAVLVPPMGETLGRAWLENAGLFDNKVSRQHLRFSRLKGSLFVTDVSGRNGTFVGGHRIQSDTPVLLEDGAVLRIGQTILVFREQFEGPHSSQPPIGDLVGPWTLGEIRKTLWELQRDVQHDKHLLRKLNILLKGPTGSGKEVLARAIASVLGLRWDRCSAVTIASISKDQFDASLFGWKRGAGAGSSNTGVLGNKHSSMVFFDEFQELPFELQPKLFRYLQEREVLPMGAPMPSIIDKVIIAATDESLQDKVESGTFRRDLLGRFRIRFELVGLKDRREDIFAIFAAAWARLRRSAKLSDIHVDAEAVEAMMLYQWPENVREIERLVVAIEPSRGVKLSVVQAGLRSSPDAKRQ